MDVVKPAVKRRRKIEFPIQFIADTLPSARCAWGDPDIVRIPFSVFEKSGGSTNVMYDLFNAYQPALMAAVASGMMGMVLLRILHRSSRHARTGKGTHDLSETAASFADDDGQ